MTATTAETKIRRMPAKCNGLDGYPSVFRVNKAHEFIIVAQKPKA